MNKEQVLQAFTFARIRSRLRVMEELLRSNDLVYLSFVKHVLNEAGIGFLELDTHTSAVEGSIGAIPRRILVAGEDTGAARRALGNASLTITD